MYHKRYYDLIFTDGFTLIELLVVISIIMLLSGILTIVFVNARSKAGQTICISNLKQLGEATFLYSDDYDEHTPPNYHNSLCVDGLNFYKPSDCDPLLLYDALKSYIRNEKVWFCPNDQFAGKPKEEWRVYHLYSSYSFQFPPRPWILDEQYEIAKDNKGYMLEIPIQLPSHYMMIYDPNDGFANCSQPTQGFNYKYGGNHGNVFNVLYEDGHVKSLPVKCNEY